MLHCFAAKKRKLGWKLPFRKFETFEKADANAFSTFSQGGCIYLAQKLPSAKKGGARNLFEKRCFFKKHCSL